MLFNVNLKTIQNPNSDKIIRSSRVPEKEINITVNRAGSVFTNHSKEDALPFPPRFCKFECNTTSDWLNRMI